MQNCIYRYGAGAYLYGFEDPILEVPILEHTLGAFQESTCAKWGFEIIDVEDQSSIPIVDEPYFCFDAKMVFTSEFLSEAIDCANTKSQQNIQFGLQPQPSAVQHALPITNHDAQLVFPFYYIGAHADLSFEEVLLKGKEYEWEIDMPTQVMPGGRYALNQNPVFAALLLSPFHLLGANMALNLNRGLALQEKLPNWLRARISKPFTRLTSMGLRLMNQKGKNCRIHPSAVVEGCILGENVTIGANAVVRMSVIGSGSFIADTAVVSFSVLGAQNFVSTGNHLVNSMTYPEVFTIHGPYQYSIFGKNAAVFATINSDIRLDLKTIRIPSAIGVMDSKQILLGVAYGHRCKIGGSNIIAAGRMVPNDYILNPPDFITLKFD